jgi:hypothetical protein
MSLFDLAVVSEAERAVLTADGWLEVRGLR